MDIRRRILAGSVSAVALALGAAAPAMAADAPPATVGEVVVTGIRESLQRAIELKRASDDQIDVISSDDIGKLPDKNVADALQRIPGVNTTSAASGEGGFDENDRVSIRGTSPSLTQVTVNGHSISTGDWFILDQFSTVGRSVSFTLLPSEIVATTKVYKTQDAALLEGGVSGAVDIITRRPLDLHQPLTLQGSLQGVWNSLTKSTKPQASGLASWQNEAGTFGALVQGFYEERSVERFGQETLGYTKIDGTPTSQMQTGISHPELNGVWAPTLIGSSLFQQERKRKGGDLMVQWRPNDRFELRLDGFYSKLDATNHNDNYMYWGSNELNNNSPTAFTVKNNTLTSASFPLIGPAGTPVNGLVVDNIIRPNASGESYYYNLDGDFRATDNLTFKGQIGYTHGVGSTPTEPAYEVDGATAISYAPSGNGWAVTPANINPQSPAGLANDWAWNETFTSVDKEVYGKIDGDFVLDHGVFKDVSFGIRYADHTRQVDGWDRGCSLGANGQCWTSPPQPFSATNPTPYPSGYNSGALGIPGLLIPIAGNPATIVSILNGITDGVHGPISSIVQPQNYYWPGAFKVTEKDWAGYVMARVGGEGWRGNFGVRVVRTEENAFVNVSEPSGTHAGDITSSAYGPYYINDVSHTYTDVLPSLNMTFDLSYTLFLRASAAETMSRPDFSALGGTVSLNDVTLTGNGGNPNLKPIKAAVYDAALEWYYAPTSLAAISVFYQDLSSYVTFGTSNAVYLNSFLSKAGAPIYSSYSISSPTNTSGEVKGVELQVQQPLPYNFGFQANATYVDSHDADGNPLVGTSRYTANLVGYYENAGISARLAYTYRSHFFVGLDRSAAENQDNYGQLDGSISYRINKNLELTFDALNITDSNLKYYALNKSQPRAVYENGTQLFFGLRVRY
ncbi:MAG: TonB-dependent receptor [Phenylobacterium sp.]|uniref:TonB-dependent receptor n=1 Tax=Phenylobacterium sp. TaxID=1871053 RepID=UPI002613B86D|nr:TonB-dependent receptor [Phenylobacterium sp.]MDB5499843.1 TonB-dependent receptor [Phenylobacterium sp.]